MAVTIDRRRPGQTPADRPERGGTQIEVDETDQMLVGSYRGRYQTMRPTLPILSMTLPVYRYWPAIAMIGRLPARDTRF